MAELTSDDIEQIPVEAFFALVEKTAGCWLWTGPRRNAFGYGGFRWRDRSWLAHRLSWMVANGRDAGPLCVLHRCDVPACVNPDHLYLGTKRDNSIDAVDRGRHPRYGHVGERNPSAKLNLDAVAEIRRRRGAGEKLASLASAFGVCEATVSNVAKRKVWRDG